MRLLDGHLLVLLICGLFMQVSIAQEETVEANDVAAKAGDVRIANHDYRTRGGKTGEYQVGTFYVPENRSDPNSRIISIGFSRFLSKKESKAPPIFILPGGPGSSYQESNPDNPQLRKTPFYITGLWGRADVVIVDQRGASSRGETLKGYVDSLPPKPDSGIEYKIEDSKRFAKSVARKYSTTKTDLRGYTVLECVEDVNELRKVLGYEQISLCGGSFGSQWSFAIMKKHPKLVARALLSGVEPLNHGYDMPSHTLAALERIWRVINKDARFQPYLPPGGMKKAAETVAQRMENGGIEVKKAGLLGLGKLETVRILGPTDFPWDEPAQILELYHNQTDRWASTRGRSRGNVGVLYHLIDSSLGVTPERKKSLFEDPANRFFSTKYFAPLMEAAKFWPTADVGDEFRKPVRCEVPVVFVHGDWDRNTPIENTFEIEPYFPNSHTLIVHQAGHGTINRELFKQHPKVFNSLMHFLAWGETKDIPERITVKPYKTFAAPKFKLPENQQ